MIGGIYLILLRPKGGFRNQISGGDVGIDIGIWIHYVRMSVFIREAYDLLYLGQRDMGPFYSPFLIFFLEWFIENKDWAKEI